MCGAQEARRVRARAARARTFVALLSEWEKRCVQAWLISEDQTPFACLSLIGWPAFLRPFSMTYVSTR